MTQKKKCVYITNLLNICVFCQYRYILDTCNFSYHLFKQLQIRCLFQEIERKIVNIFLNYIQHRKPETAQA
jgi:hypothetical protein